METDIQALLKSIDELNHQVNSFRPLNQEQELRLIQKLRLDWNFHSCNIEGNTLTYGETKDLLFWGITAKGKPFKDHLELKGHNQAVEWIFDVVKEKNRPLTENFIRELHTLIIAPDSYTDAQTPDGTKIKKEILRGEYKKTPNHVLTKTGEMFYFASPEETPAKMQDLLEWFRKNSDENNTHPLILACLFHYQFVRIHPFDDGNGRMSRILMNFILMMQGFPPVIIPTNEKSDYISALEYADKENINNFIQYIGEKLIASLELVLKAAKGESIEDEADLDKMLAMLDKRMEGVDANRGITKERSEQTQLEVFEKCIEPLNLVLFSALIKFNKYFKSVNININKVFIRENLHDPKEINKELKNLLTSTNHRSIKIKYTYNVLTKLGLPNYNLGVLAHIIFDQLNYQIEFSYGENNQYIRFKIFEKLYHQILYSDEIQDVVKTITTYLIEKIENEIGKIENGN